MSAELATLFIAMSNGVQWTGIEGHLRAGQAILIQGPGQMGAACVAAARSMGAGTVIVTGLGSDADRLEICRRLGADEAIDAESADVRGRVLELTAGKGVDVAIDATADSGTGPLHVAIDALKRQGGHMVVQGRGRVDGFPMDRILQKAVTLHVARGHSYRSVERGLEILKSGRCPLELMHTHNFALGDAALAIDATRGELVEGHRGLHAAVLPWS
jgi:threonine dehydrogenase-like Zn-dependent dehydrogenase